MAIVMISTDVELSIMAEGSTGSAAIDRGSTKDKGFELENQNRRAVLQL
jgi:hypothetical protein